MKNAYVIFETMDKLNHKEKRLSIKEPGNRWTLAEIAIIKIPDKKHVGSVEHEKICGKNLCKTSYKIRANCQVTLSWKK